MRPRDDNKLLRSIVGLALILAGIILFYVGKKGLSRFSETPRTPSPAVVAQPEYSNEVPSRLPPIKLKRIEGPRSPKKSAPPRSPVPPITPDRK